MTRASTLPISVRLTAAFAFAMAVVLAVTSLGVYERQREGSERAVSRRLRDRREDVSLAVKEVVGSDPRESAKTLRAADSGTIQIYRRSGEVLASSKSVTGVRVVSWARIRTATSTGHQFDTGTRRSPLREMRVLYFLEPRAHIVVALIESEGPAHEALERLAVELFTGAAVAVLLGSLLAFGLAHAALSPVERLRLEAERHGRDDDDVSLPVPASRDEIGRLAVTLNELLARMREATLRERRFVAEAGHELRTPLATMIAEIELALETGGAADARGSLESLHEEAQRLARLSDQLLQLSTVRERILPEEVDVGALVSRRVARYRSAFEHVEEDLAAPVPVMARADPGALAQAVDNLLDNAAVHGGHTVLVSVREHKHLVHVHVVDDGAGIDDGIAARAFERFARADDARSRRGSGLGLPIVRAIAQAHGGDAGIGARPDGCSGTDAWFCIQSDSARAQ